jgi:hypothetical protein
MEQFIAIEESYMIEIRRIWTGKRGAIFGATFVQRWVTFSNTQKHSKQKKRAYKLLRLLVSPLIY